MFNKAMSVNVVVPLVQIRLKKILNFFKFVSVTKLQLELVRHVSTLTFTFDVFNVVD